MESSLAYATTPLALASLAIIAGVGLLKIVVAGRNNALSRLITHYGFAVVIVFGLLGNAAYLYGVYQASEAIILGSVVDKDGRYLPNVTIDTGGHARGMTSDTGDFVLAIPASRASDSYEVSAVLAGYDKAIKTVKRASHMFVRFELQPKQFQIADMVKLLDSELVAGHYMGLPVVHLSLSVENPGTSLLTVNNFSLTLTSPSGKTRQLVQTNSAVTMNGPAGPPLPQVQVKPGERFSWANGFVQYDNQVQQLAASAVKALQSIQEFREYGPRVGQKYLPDDLTSSIQQALLSNWFWEKGTTSIRLAFSANGAKYELVRSLTLSGDQVNAMRQSSKYYGAGYGVIFGTELVPVGSAQPGHRVAVEGA